MKSKIPVPNRLAALTVVSGLSVVLSLTSSALAAPPSTVRASVSSTGGEGDGASYNPSISSDGRFVAFESYASNLVAGGSNGYHIYMRDLKNRVNQRVSVSNAGEEGNEASYNPSISANNRFVAFESYASNLVAGDTNGSGDIFVRDLKTGVTRRASVDSEGNEGNDYSYDSFISANGRFVVFTSNASNLVTGDSNGTIDAFVRDLKTGVTQRVSISNAGEEGNDYSYSPSISANNRFVAFTSKSSNLVTGDSNGVTDVFVRDLKTGVTQRVSVDSEGNESNSDSFVSSISANGRFVAFVSNASNLVAGDNNSNTDVFVHDLKTGVTQRVSVDSAGAEVDSYSSSPSISESGRFVAFESQADDLVPGVVDGRLDVFVHDLKTGATERVSEGTGEDFNYDAVSASASISATGRYVAFYSGLSDLVEGDNNGLNDIFVRRRW